MSALVLDRLTLSCLGAVALVEVLEGARFSVAIHSCAVSV